ncbi:hypothetical protein ACWOFR_10965 [Carnobacterium gallinarum]|uniref:hypothetical protein n=1 Tax=Carnobacterium gallinarum TaxID=2749 RepID=UPI001B80A909|nr:hypothetical protein [Carnobacterium gallinarum]
MSHELVATIGVLGIVIGALITQRSTRIVKESELRQKEYQAKRDILTDIYKSLITIINLYPDESPNDIVEHINYPPNYSLESYDAIFSSLDFKLEDCTNQLSIPDIDYYRKSDIETEISNINYAKKGLTANKDYYFKAVKEKVSFVESDKTVFDLYVGQNVKNCLVRFEVVIKNVFISGYSVGKPDDPNDNTIKIARRELINAMRNDIGIV